jgi:hypothetical protein
MSCPCEPASFKPNVRIGARYGKASKHSGHSCPHPERLELPKMIHRQRLQRQLPDQSMGVLLKIEGNCSCLKAKVAHMVGHLPTAQGRALIATVEQKRADVQIASLEYLSPEEQAEVNRAMILLVEGARRRREQYEPATRETGARGAEPRYG